MQTLRDALPLGARSLAIAAACAMLMPLAGCSAPNLEAQVNEAAKPDTCESSYESAVGESGTMAAGHPLMMRYLSATAAASSWAEVASSCPARAVEGAVHSAQSSYTAQVLAARLGITVSSAPTMDYGSLVRLSMDADALSKIVL
ncbi:hypothetical protein KIH75_06460, partial [Bifidobacterium sp. 64T4]|nr:hypothetical protein [Bifidobacterium pongonis]